MRIGSWGYGRRGHGSRGPQKAVVGRGPWGYGRRGYGSRSPQKAVVGRRPWGYAGEAMEVGAPRRPSWEGGRGDMQGVCAEGCMQEGVYQRRCIRGGGEEEGRKEGRRRAGTSFEI